LGEVQQGSRMSKGNVLWLRFWWVDGRPDRFFRICSPALQTV